MEPKRLYRSVVDKKIGGVCSGLAEYFDIDPLLVRLIFVVLALAGGGGVLIYLVLWVITPEKPMVAGQPFTNPGPGFHQQPNPDPQAAPAGAEMPKDPAPTQDNKDIRSKGSLIGAMVLITLGILFLADEFIPNIDFGDLWPVILIVIGAGLLINSMGKRKSEK